MPEFVFMLTRGDRTVRDAREIYAEVSDSGVTHVGFKDIGLPEEQLAGLLADIRQNEHKVHIEVVSETPQDSLASARMARKLSPDYLLGGTLVEEVQEIIDGAGIRFMPYIGEVVGHPCLLRGSIRRISDDARKAEAAGADGINLLAYRYDGDVPALVEAVVGATHLPVLCAGSIETPEQIRMLSGLGVWGFTVGTAVLDSKVVSGGSLVTQIEAVLAAAA